MNQMFIIQFRPHFRPRQVRYWHNLHMSHFPQIRWTRLTPVTQVALQVTLVSHVDSQWRTLRSGNQIDTR